MPGDDKRGAVRYRVDAEVHGSVADAPFDARLQDVSATGAAVVGLGGVAYDNNAFVMMHMDGLGERSGHVRRRLPEGFAVEFEDADEEEQKKLEAAAKLRALDDDDLIG